MTIRSFPFLVHLVASGRVLSIDASLAHVSAGPVVYDGVRLPAIDFDRIDVDIQGLQLKRGALVHRRVQVTHVSRVTAVAIVSQATLDKDLNLPLELGAGRVGIGGLSIRASLTVHDQRLTLHLPQGRMLVLQAPPADILPCKGGATIIPGALRLACTFKHLPASLRAVTYSF